MPTQTIKKYTDLKKRVGHFLNSNSYSRDEIRYLIDQVKPLGDIVIFGGMLRDLSILGNAGFKSDVDLVINTDDIEKLEYTLSQFSYNKNKFGGYRIKLGKWYIDLWNFSTTWAFRHGYIVGVQFDDLCKTTFFDWDAIVYEIFSGSIHAIEGYIDRINDRVLDINLKPCPNPIANIVKAFRYYEKYNAILMPRLVEYIHAYQKEYSSDEIFLYEKKSHEWPLLEKDRVRYIYQTLESHQSETPLFPLKPSFNQPGLWVNG